MHEKDDFDLMLFLPYLLNQAAEECSLGFQRHYKDHYSMLRTEWRVLFHLGYYGEMTAREICERSNIHKTKVSRAVAALQKRRFLTREKLVHDRRSEVLRLSTSGNAAYRDLRESARSYDETATASFSKSEADALRKALIKLARL